MGILGVFMVVLSFVAQISVVVLVPLLGWRFGRRLDPEVAGENRFIRWIQRHFGGVPPLGVAILVLGIAAVQIPWGIFLYRVPDYGVIVFLLGQCGAFFVYIALLTNSKLSNQSAAIALVEAAMVSVLVSCVVMGYCFNTYGS